MNTKLKLTLKNDGDCWLVIKAPSGRGAAINLGKRGGVDDKTIVGQVIREVVTTEWKSCARWPEGTVSEPDNITTDTHQTADQAYAVCQLLKREGFGGLGKVFPLAAWVEAVEEPATKVELNPGLTPEEHIQSLKTRIHELMDRNQVLEAGCEYAIRAHDLGLDGAAIARLKDMLNGKTQHTKFTIGVLKARVEQLSNELTVQTERARRALVRADEYYAEVIEKDGQITKLKTQHETDVHVIAATCRELKRAGQEIAELKACFNAATDQCERSAVEVADLKVKLANRDHFVKVSTERCHKFPKEKQPCRFNCQRIRTDHRSNFADYTQESNEEAERLCPACQAREELSK